MERLNSLHTEWHLTTFLVAVGCFILACGAFADQQYGSICGTTYIRTLPDFAKLDNCRVIEGNLSVGPIDHLGKSFPKLIEITDALVLIRVKGLRSVGQLFPNLVVIGGQSLLAGYAFVVNELFDLEEIGLPNLTVIRNGAVRIEKNPRLCYIDTVDWDRITKGVSSEENCFKDNNDVCVNICPSQCNLTEGVKRCWNAEHCQRMLSCPPECESGYCLGDVCCHSHCIGGCSGPLATQCTSCNAVVHSTDTDGETCLQSCPAGLFMYKNRRCLTADDCTNFVDYRLSCEDTDIKGCMKLFVISDSESNKVSLCTEGCPAKYQPGGDDATRCVPCKNGKCPKVCRGKTIESLDAAEDLKDCTIIDGHLKLRIKHCVDEEKMEEYLGNITEVTDWLDISYSYGLHSLSMFRSLRKLGGQQLIEERYVLRVYHNPNLQELFTDESLSGFELVKGSVLFQRNGKLNFAKILEFLSKAGIDHSVDDEDVSTDTNGDKLSTSMPKLQLLLLKVSPHVAFVNWQPSKLVESNHFIGYTLHWKEVSNTPVTVFASADACTDIGWRRKEIDCPNNICVKFDFISGISPWTRYAVYIRAFTLANDDAVSNVLYFRSTEEAPTVPLNVHVETKTPWAFQLTWDPPAQPNGNATEYIITWTHIPIRQEEYSLRDYCTNPPHEDKDEKLVNTAGKTEWCPCHKHSKDLSQYIQDIHRNTIYIKRLKPSQHTITQAYAQEFLHHRSSVHIVSEEQFTATGLEHYEMYSFEVMSCQNRVQDKSTLCGSSIFVLGRTSPDELADAITSVSLEGVTDGIRVKWQDPPNPNGIILKYEIKYSAANMEQPKMLCIPYHNASVNQVTVSPLKPGDYKFWVRATSLAGLGPWTPYYKYHL